MTKDSLSETVVLRALVSETSDNLLAQMLGFVVDRLMALDVELLCAAPVRKSAAQNG